jgi:DNA-binding MarR family transcriptional regulator
MNSENNTLAHDPAGPGAGEHIGRLLLRAHRMVSEDGVAILRRHGHPALRAGHLPVFTNVDPQGIRITELAERAGMTAQMMGRLVRELEELGYLQTTPDEQDRRAVVVRLTGLGDRFRQDADRAIEDLARHYEIHAGAETVRALRESLLKLLCCPRCREG